MSTLHQPGRNGAAPLQERRRAWLDRLARGLARLLVDVFFRDAEVSGARARAGPGSGALRREPRQRARRSGDPGGRAAAPPALPRQAHAVEERRRLAAAPARRRGAGLPRGGRHHVAQPRDLRALLRRAGRRRRGGALSGGHQPRSTLAPAAAHRCGAHRARRARERQRAGDDRAGRAHVRGQAPLPLAAPRRDRRADPRPTTMRPKTTRRRWRRSPSRSTPRCAR